jgi:phytol kinase
LNQLTYFFIFLIAFASLIALGEWLYHSLKINSKNIRKILQVSTGLLSLVLPVFFTNEYYVLLICGVIQLFLVLSVQNNYLKSIHSIHRKTYGSMVFPIVIYLIYLVWYHSGNGQNGSQSYAYFFLPILIMALCDPLASIVGENYPIYKLSTLSKSIGGTLAFWALAFLLSVIILSFSQLFNTKDITWVAIFIATISSITELFSKKGLDNLLVPISVLLAMYIVEYFF